MEVKTKFNIGSKVWVMINNRAVECTVSSIHVSILPSSIVVSYAYNDEGHKIHEDRAFASKEELLKSL